MIKKKSRILIVFCMCVILCSCSIGKPKETEINSINIKNTENIYKQEDEKNYEEEVKNENSHDLEKHEENKLVLPEVEVEGYGNEQSGD